jgi:hypothetical protein
MLLINKSEAMLPMPKPPRPRSLLSLNKESEVFKRKPVSLRQDVCFLLGKLPYLRFPATSAWLQITFHFHIGFGADSIGGAEMELLVFTG